MNSNYAYAGEELQLFSQAKNWKKYFAALIAPYLGKQVLEAGAGIGTTTHYLNDGKAGSAWILLEPDHGFCKELQKSVDIKILPSNCKVQHGIISSITGKDLFDTIIYIDVLEHIADDQQEINHAASLLKEGGYLIILSPAHSSLYSRFDASVGHFRRYDKQSLGKLTAGTSLHTIRLSYLDSMSWLLSLGNKWLLKQSYPTKRQIHIWDTFFVPVSVITDKLLFHNFGKSILGIWQKT